MEESARNDLSVFSNEKIEPLVLAAIHGVLEGKNYVESEVNGQTTLVCESVLAALAELSMPFKFMVNCIIMQNTGAGMSSAISEYCDGAVDGSCVARWPAEKDKGKTNLLVAVTVFGSALFRE
jgi:dynein light chain Tctex-type 1